jgi:AbrB family looped-hinge helix DNA binding protein
MKEFLLTISSKGQVTIPAEIRRRLGLGKHEKIALVMDEKKGDVRLRMPKYPTLESVRGAAGTAKKKRRWKEVEETAYEDALASEFKKT